MFAWLQLFKGRPKRAIGGPSGAIGMPRQRLIDSLDDLIKVPGKACYRTLMELVQSSTRDEFVSFLHCPALVGSSIRDGVLHEPANSSGTKWRKTQLFNPSILTMFVEGSSIDQSIFLLRKPVTGGASELKRFSIGRSSGNDLLMMDFAISRQHALIELRGTSYFLKDLGSSNGTFVNGKLIDDRGTELGDQDGVRFARYEFQFLSATRLYDLLRVRIPAAAQQG